MVGNLLNQLEVHRTPKYENWLDIAKIEPNVLTRQSLRQRIPPLKHSGQKQQRGPKPKSNPEESGLAIYRKGCEEETQTDLRDDLRESRDKKHQRNRESPISRPIGQLFLHA
jgi:hypothetical protein